MNPACPIAAQHDTTTADAGRRIVIMGVSGCGKSSIGAAVGQRLGIPYVDGDDFHPQRNIDKMAAGAALGDSDRAGWLAALAARLDTARRAAESLVLGCSALKHRYRQRLRTGDPRLEFLFLDGTFDQILARMRAPAFLFTTDARGCCRFPRRRAGGHFGARQGIVSVV